MNRTIWKFPLKITGRQEVVLPKGACILHVDEQVSEALTLWALVDPGAEEEQRVIHIYGTGHPIYAPEPLNYLGTVATADGFVWHIFEGRGAESEARQFAQGGRVDARA